MNQEFYPGNLLLVARTSPLRVEWCNTLTSLGLSVRCTHSLRAARSFVAESPGWIDYLIIDPDLPDGNGTPQFVRRMLGEKQPPTVAVMLHHLKDTLLLQMASYGVQLVPKPRGYSSLRLLVRLLEHRRNTQAGIIAFARRYRLSPRETEVLEAQFNGISDKMIARVLNSTEHAINQTIRRIHKKLRASTFREIVSQWRRHMTDANSSAEDMADFVEPLKKVRTQPP